MTFTWDATDLSTDLAKVRATIGDTNSNDQLLSDEHITAWLTFYDDDVLLASRRCVRDIIAKLARDFDRSAAGFSGSRSQKINHYKLLLEELEGETGGLAEMFVGGLSKDTEESFDEDEDYKGPKLRLGMDDYPGSGVDGES